MKSSFIVSIIAALFAIILIVAIAAALPYPIGLIIGLLAIGGAIYYVVKKKGQLAGASGSASSKWFSGTQRQAYI